MLTNLFNENKPDLDPNKDYLTELVGEGKKFKTVQDLARSKLEADAFIERLKGENEGVRQELNTRLTMEQFLEKMTTSNQGNQNQNTNGTNDGTQNPSGTSENLLKPEDIEKIVLDRIESKEKERIQARNFEEVQSALIRSFGNDYVSKLTSIAAELSLDKETLNNMAKTQPKAFLKLVGATEATPQQRNELFTPPSTRQTTSFAPTGNQRNWKYYENIRKTDPATYFTPSIQNQMHRDALEQEEAFYS